MRAVLERSPAARAAVLAVATIAGLALAHAASAGDDLGLRRATFWPAPQAAAALVDIPVAAAPRRRHARRIWAASRMRPLRIALRDPFRAARHAAFLSRHRPVRLLARLRPAAEPQVIFPKLIVLPKPPRPALVSIYQDRTLRTGDAVMMADGIHVFHGTGVWPHRPRDFAPLTSVAMLDWRLRQTLNDLDRNPPTRWSSMGSTAG